MTTQQAEFTCCGRILSNHGDLIENANTVMGGTPANCTKLIIEARLKKEILTKLMQMNITAASLFPGLDGLGKSISEIVRVEATFP